MLFLLSVVIAVHSLFCLMFQFSTGNPIYETYYKQVDPTYTGRVGASEAALFLKKSGLSDIILGKIWDLADPEGKGYLDKQGFYVALRLVACAQNGHDVNMSSLSLTVPPPKFVEEKAKFDGIFESLLPVNGLLSGDKVKPVLMNSKLPLDILGRVWDLSDIDKDGHLDKDEFAVPAVNWVVPLAEKVRYDEIFLKTDTDMDGFVSGQEVKDIFMHSGLSQNLLAHIWALADTRQMGKLSKDQFALAMYLIQQKVSKGIDPPQVLTPDMIPPTERNTPLQTLAGYLTPVGAEISALPEMRRESDLKLQEDDLNRAKAELNRLQQEETQLEQSIQAGKVQLETIIKSLKSTQEEINQARNKLSQLQESQQEVTKSIEEYNEALNGIHGGSLTNLADMSESLGHPERSNYGTMDDPFKNKALMFTNNTQELHTDPFQSEDPFKSDPFKGADPFKGSDPFQHDPFAEQPPAPADPFGGDPFKESDPFRSSAHEDFFKKPVKSDPFTSDPFTKPPALPSKPDPFESTDPFTSSSISSKGPDPFGTLDPFGSGAFSSGEGFADFSQMSKSAAPDPFASSFGGGGFSDDPFKSKADTPALPPKKNVPPRPKPPSGKSTPVSHLGPADFPKPHDPFQPFGADSTDPFQSKKGFGDPFSGKDPFAPSSSSKTPKDSSLGFADFSSWVFPAPTPSRGYRGCAAHVGFAAWWEEEEEEEETEEIKEEVTAEEMKEINESEEISGDFSL
ncbi:hypothetical protein BTVI_24198 [Pitangus sulphuratus]|nr:hypothetical protein BTVI_24198 [Pitangus sulphuratus]